MRDIDSAAADSLKKPATIGPEIPIEGSVDIQEPLKVEIAP